MQGSLSPVNKQFTKDGWTAAAGPIIAEKQTEFYVRSRGARGKQAPADFREKLHRVEFKLLRSTGPSKTTKK